MSKLRKLLVRETEEQRPVSKAERRVASLQTHDLVPWADQCLYAVGRCLSEWSKDAGRLELLDEAKEGAEALQIIVTELQRRAEALVAATS